MVFCFHLGEEQFSHEKGMTNGIVKYVQQINAKTYSLTCALIPLRLVHPQKIKHKQFSQVINIFKCAHSIVYATQSIREKSGAAPWQADSVPPCHAIPPPRHPAPPWSDLVGSYREWKPSVDWTWWWQILVCLSWCVGLARDVVKGDHGRGAQVAALLWKQSQMQRCSQEDWLALETQQAVQDSGMGMSSQEVWRKVFPWGEISGWKQRRAVQGEGLVKVGLLKCSVGWARWQCQLHCSLTSWSCMTGCYLDERQRRKVI